ncbi:MAG TPA: hypothetical protein VIJ16_10865 [Gemmatimonadaceae bacterium]
MRSVRRYSLALAPLLVLGCGGMSRSPAPPSVDFLLVSGDSTYWVTGTPAGVRVRGSSISLARYDGRFHEIYVADDDHSYEDALLLGQLVFSRDLLTNDSVSEFSDTLVKRIAHAYAVAHPDDAPLSPDDLVRDRPTVSASSEVSVLDVHGPYLSLEYHADTHQRPQPRFHTTWRAVVDLRVGHNVALRDLIGAEPATRVVAQGRQLYAAILDSAKSSERELPDFVPSVLSEVTFDEHSFALTQMGRRPAVSFAGRIAGRRDGDAALPLPAIPIDAQSWWADVARTLPVAAAQGASQWTTSAYTVRVRPDTADSVLDVTLVDSAQHVWNVGQVHAPARRVFWLDRPPVDSATRRALRRAFDEASLYDENARVAAAHLLPARSVFRAASRVRPSPPPTLRRVERRHVPPVPTP